MAEKVRVKLENLKASKRHYYSVVRFLSAAAIAFTLSKFSFYSLEGSLYDTRVALSPTGRISNHLALIAVDQKTSTALKSDPSVEDHAKLLTQIAAENPRAVVYLTDPTKWVGTPDQKMDFVLRAQTISNFFFATEQTTPTSPQKSPTLPKPFDNLSVVSAPITRDNITFAEDKVTRRFLISFDGQPLLQPILASMVSGQTDYNSIRGSFSADGTIFGYIKYHPQGTYEQLSFSDIRDGRFPKGILKNKIVLIGIDNQLDTDDYILTPYSRFPLAMSKLEAQANIIDTLINNNGIVKSHNYIDLFISLAMAFLTIIFVWKSRPIKGILLVFGQAVTFTLIAFILFSFFGIWINLIHPIITIFATYYFFIPYRLIGENRRSWEYQQKNKILTQVEELKTNFMSMMSHDLKTPLARIQGMAELVISDTNKLSTAQKDAVKTIMKSGEELERFIGGVLDLSRIESKEVKLHKTSKDINSILKEVVKKYEFNAKAKGITIATQMDPLFSIKVDVDLIRQVFSNLVENAIKYSPENSTITVLSKEDAGEIKVSVADNGVGISTDELENIFLKFYRSKEAKASPIKGSGLGLYLAKYFVELHNGKINVVSEPQQGSTFTVSLPMNG